MQSLIASYALTIVLGVGVVVLSAVAGFQVLTGKAVDPAISQLLVVLLGLLTAHTNAAAVTAAIELRKSNGK